MNDAVSPLLTYVFEKDILPWPANGVLVYGGHYGSWAHDLTDFDCIQGFKPYADLWNAHKVKTMATLSDQKKYSHILYQCHKQKEAALYDLACGLNVLDDHGVLLAVAANDSGGKRLAGWFEELGLKPEKKSKSKCQIVWARKSNVDVDAVQKFIQAGDFQETVYQDQNFVTKPGIFGWNKIDTGSKILTAHIPDDLKGIGADFGCGYGYLSRHILQNNPKIKKLYAVEADYNALQCARQNLKPDVAQYLWEDLTSALTIEKLDWIVMNPPFHDGKAQDNTVGQRFIETAAQALKPGGRLYMVANAHLPYEKTLKQKFTSFERLTETQGFKVFQAIR